jgi:hypothetical protein
MISKVYLLPEAPIGWAIGLVTLSESGEVETSGFLTSFEVDYPDEKWLTLFRTLEEARIYVATTLPTPAPEGDQWAYTELSASELLGYLRDYPELKGVLLDPGSDEANFVPANVLIDVLERNLGESESDAA